MITRSTFLRRIGWALAVAVCAAIAWSQTIRKPNERKPIEGRANPAALPDDREESASKPVQGGPARRAPKTNVDDSDPDFEVIRPWYSAVVTILLKDGTGATREGPPRAGVVVDGRGYILTLPRANDGEEGDDEETGDDDQNLRISVLFYDGTDATAKVVDTDRSLGLSLLKVELPRRYPAIEAARIREPVDRERVFLVPEQLRERTLTGRITSSSVNFGGGTVFFECNIRLPNGEGGSLLITEAGEPIGIMTDKVVGKKASYGIPLESARHFMEQRIAEHDEDLQRKTSPRRRPSETLTRVDPLPARRPVPPETLVLMGQRGAAEIEVDKTVTTIRELLASRDPVPESMIEEHRRRLNDLLRQAFDLKVQVEEAQLREFRSRLDRLEQQIDQRKTVRDKIVEQRAAELISHQNTNWPSDPPDQNETGFEQPEPRARRRAPQLSNPNDRRRGGRMPGRTRPPVEIEPESPEGPPSEFVPPDMNERDRDPDPSPADERDDPNSINEEQAHTDEEGARLTVRLRLEDPPEGKQPAKRQPKQSVQFVGLTGKSLNYDKEYHNVLLDDPRDRVCVFQNLEPGHYKLFVQLSEGTFNSMTRQFFVRDEKPVELTVKCPRVREPATLLMTIPPFPKEFLAEDVEGRLDCRIASTVRTLLIDGNNWEADASDYRTITFDTKTGQAIHFTRWDRKSRREFVTDMEDLDDKDRLIFLDSGSYSVAHFSLKISRMVGRDIWQHDDSYVKSSAKSSEIRAISPGENTWKLEYPEEVLEQARQSLEALKGQSE